MRIDCARLAACDQTRYNEEKRRRDLWQEQQMYLYVSNRNEKNRQSRYLIDVESQCPMQSMLETRARKDEKASGMRKCILQKRCCVMVMKLTDENRYTKGER